MLTLILRRLALGVLTLLGGAFVVFAATQMLPGDIAEAFLGREATPEAVAALREQFGLNRPPLERFVEWLLGALRGDLGVSMATGHSINEQLFERLGNTLMLGGVAALICVPLGIGLGMLAAVRPNGTFNRVVNVTSLFSVSVPEFFWAYVLIAIVAVKLHLAPSLANINADMSVSEVAYRMILPVATLVAVGTTAVLRMTRASVSEILAEPYIEMAYLKGIRLRRIVGRHALPNSAAPIATIVALVLADLATGTITTEVIFTYPGIARYMVDAVALRDIPVVQACGLVFTAIYVVVNLIADIIAIVANPRIRYPR